MAGWDKKDNATIDTVTRRERNEIVFPTARFPHLMLRPALRVYMRAAQNAMHFFNCLFLSLSFFFVSEQPIFSCKAHVFHIDPKTKRSWLPASSAAVSVSFFYDSSRALYRIISVEGAKAVINSTITPNMTFTKTSQKFGQWSDVRANTVYGLGFGSEVELNKFIEKFNEVKEATRSTPAAMGSGGGGGGGGSTAAAAAGAAKPNGTTPTSSHQAALAAQAAAVAAAAAAAANATSASASPLAVRTKQEYGE